MNPCKGCTYGNNICYQECIRRPDLNVEEIKDYEDLYVSTGEGGCAIGCEHYKYCNYDKTKDPCKLIHIGNCTCKRCLFIKCKYRGNIKNRDGYCIWQKERSGHNG